MPLKGQQTIKNGDMVPAAGCGEPGRKRGRLWDSLFIAFSMYSRIPVPRTEWSSEGMRYALCFFPLVGVAVGMIMGGFFYFAGWQGMGETAFCCIGTALPIILTGGIHMDGFLDVVDARSSCLPRERKLEILKDPHTGAFAIIGGGVYLILYLAVFSGLKDGGFPAAAGVYVMERALSGWSVVSFPKAKKDGLASTFAGEAKKKAVQVSMVLWGMAAAVFLVFAGGILAGGLSVAAAFLIFWQYRRMAVKEFGGITGDLAGYFLQLCELGMMMVLSLLL